MKNMLLSDLLNKGFEKGLVKLIPSPNAGCICCQIGEYWFYFIGMEDEEKTPEQILSEYSQSELINLIEEAIIDLPEDERECYKCYLVERIGKPFVDIEGTLEIETDCEQQDVICSYLSKILNLGNPRILVDDPFDEEGKTSFYASTEGNFINTLKNLGSILEKSATYSEEVAYKKKILRSAEWSIWWEFVEDGVQCYATSRHIANTPLAETQFLDLTSLMNNRSGGDAK